MTDPFDALSSPPEPQTPRPRFARELRARLVAELGLDQDVPTVDLPDRRPHMSTQTRAAAPVATAVTPYLTASNATEALDWYSRAFGAVEHFRVVGDDGRLGHAEFAIGDAHFMLSDEYEEMGVLSPTTLGGTPTTLYLQVADVDTVYRQAVEAGATAQREPEDQTHGNRTGTLVDPYGHRWMLSQPLEAFDLDTYAECEGGGFTVQAGPGAAASSPRDSGGIWAGAFYEDALGAIRFLVDVFGFEEQLVVTADDDRTVVHSQLRWPEGGVVSAGTYDPDNVFNHPPGEQALYVITADPQSVWERCEAAGVEVIRPPESPDHDPEGLSFSVRDPEGNIWSFGTYAG